MSTPLERTNVAECIAKAVQQKDLIGHSDDQARSGAIDDISHSGSSVISSEDRHNSRYRTSLPVRVSGDCDTSELSRAHARIRELTQAAGGKRSESKNKTRRCIKNLPPADRYNMHQVYSYIDEKLWSHHHIRHSKWPNYNTKNKTMCQRILRCGVQIPAGTTQTDYWQSLIVMAVNNKYTFNKSNVFEKAKVQHRGNVRSACVILHFDINFTHMPTSLSQTFISRLARR